MKTFRGKTIALYLGVLFALVGMILLEVLPLRYSSDETLNGLIKNTLPLLLGGAVAITAMIYGKSKLFSLPQKMLFCLPALLIAVNNFPFYTYLSGRGSLSEHSAGIWFTYAFNCLTVGIYEECLFRGVLFPLLARAFAPNKRGLVKAIALSCVLFGVSHLFNLFAGAGVADTLLQMVYSTLVGGLCAFLLIKTKSIYPCIATHALYNFCGLLLPTLGEGSWANLPQFFIMAIPALLVGIFALFHLVKYSEREREILYEKLGFSF